MMKTYIRLEFEALFKDKLHIMTLEDTAVWLYLTPKHMVVYRNNYFPRNSMKN